MLITVTTLILAGGTFFIGWRLVGTSNLSPPWKPFFWFLVMLPVFFPSVLFALKALHMEAWFDRLLALSFLVTGFFSFLLVFAIFRDALLVGFNMIASVTGKMAFAGKETIFAGQTGSFRYLFRISNGLIVVTSALLFGIGVFQAFRTPQIKPVTILIDDLPAGLDGFRIVQLSDIHLDVMTGQNALEKIVHQVNEIHPDMTVITGDLVDGSVKKLGHDAQVLKNIKSPVCFVNGNHEYYFGAKAWDQFLETIGITVLDNEKTIIEKDGARLMIAGIPDISMIRRRVGGRTFSFPEANGADFYILLSHQPGAAFKAAEMGYDLQLSGHTHGGQFFPWNLLIKYVQPFSKGLYHYKGMWIYTSQGTGFWGPPVRLGPVQEITVLTIRRNG
ncbi:MAG: metallophosphoesterase [Proteobacteria bacterium]|nr:metallophosphoesterase [Pseudomonadota bacterium]